MSKVDESRAFVVHLKSAHRQLDKHVRAVEQLFAMHGGNNKSATSEDLVARLHTLRNELQFHFEEEDSGGCLEEAACGQMELSQEVVRLERQHHELLLQLDWIIDIAEESEGTISKLLRHEFEQFAPKLRTHEAAEKQILAKGFYLDADDVEY